MSHGVTCEREGCGHFEGAHDPETGKCKAAWGPPASMKRCGCPGLILATGLTFRVEKSHHDECPPECDSKKYHGLARSYFQKG